jgi:hypothetical protein
MLRIFPPTIAASLGYSLWSLGKEVALGGLVGVLW